MIPLLVGTLEEIKEIYQVPDTWAGIWPMDDGVAAQTDISKNGNDTNAPSGTVLSEAGQSGFGTSIDFGSDANSYFDVPADPTFETTDALTLQRSVITAPGASTGNIESSSCSTGKPQTKRLWTESSALSAPWLRTSR